MGGSPGGGGGGSGSVNYPSYMMSHHQTLLNEMLAAVQTATSNNPFSGESSFDPTNIFTGSDAAICTFASFVNAMVYSNDWATAAAAAQTRFDTYLYGSAYIAADVAAYSAVLTDNLNTDILPRFKSGMRDINAVQSSAFVLGQANIEAMKARDVAKYSAGLNEKLIAVRSHFVLSSIDRMMTNMIQKVSFEKDIAAMTIDSNRIKVVGFHEQVKENISIDENAAKWPLDCYQHSANMLASIGGGTSSAQKRQVGAAQSALGGAMSGAALGAAIPGGGLLSIGIGALLGGAAGLFGN